MLGKLAPCGGGPPIPLLKPKLLVGRHRDCDVALAFPSVSSRHCELELRDGYWLVRDLGSTNGTRVNGIACTRDWLLPNDVLGVAKYRYTVVYTPPAGRPPPHRVAPPTATPERPPSPAGSIPDPVAGPAVPPRGAAAGGPALGKLVPCGGGPPIPLLRPRLVVGRHDDCDVVLRAAGGVSGRHCQLEWADGGWSVRDLGSKNGIRVDGVRCEAQPLPPGSVLWVGGLRFEVVYAAPGAAAQPQPRPPLFSQSLLEKAGLARWRPPEPPPRGPGTAGAEDESPQRYTLDDPQ
jgi:pSer/pThr/pTyr-binding forkhead associated (FHA) protein